MALTVTALRPSTDVLGARPHRFLKATFDSSYASGGEALDLRAYRPATAPQAEPQIVQVTPENIAAAGYQFVYDKVNHKLIATWVDTSVDGAPLADVASTTDLSGVQVNIVAIWS